MPERLVQSDIIDAADGLGCEPEALTAVLSVECGYPNRTGFDRVGRPVILLEAHHVHRLNGGREAPGLSVPRWDRSLYTGSNEGEWRRFAAVADRYGFDVAAQACSWGLGQVMGSNWEICGFPDLKGFVAAMKRSEPDQLRAVTGYISGVGLTAPLRRKDWRAFARGYNGPGYQRNRYAEKLEAAYWRAKGRGPEPTPGVLHMGMAGDEVMKLQRSLQALGYRITADGLYGPHTKQVVKQFQEAHGLDADGAVGPETLAAMGKASAGEAAQ